MATSTCSLLTIRRPRRRNDGQLLAEAEAEASATSASHPGADAGRTARPDAQLLAQFADAPEPTIGQLVEMGSY